jgi:WD40 repeat protein
MKDPFVLRRHGKDVFTVTRTVKADTPGTFTAATAPEAIERFMKLLDEGKYGHCWDESASSLQEFTTKDAFVRETEAALKALGEFKEREVRGWQSMGDRYTTFFRATYANGECEQTITAYRGQDKLWRVGGYQLIRSRKSKPANDHMGGPPIPVAAPAPLLVREIYDGRSVFGIEYSGDGQALVAASRGYFSIYEPASGKNLYVDDLKYAQFFAPLTISADGRTAAVAAGDIFLYDLATHKRIGTIPIPLVDDKRVHATDLALAPDGQALAAVVGREILYYDRATKQVEHTRPSDDNVRPIGVAYSPNGRFLVVASYVNSEKTTRISVLNATNRELLGRRDLAGFWTPLQLAASRERVFISGNVEGKPELVVLSAAKCEVLEREKDLPAVDVRSVILSPDRALLAIADANGKVQIWDRNKKRMIFAWNPHPNAEPEFSPKPGARPMPMSTYVAFSPDGRSLSTSRGVHIRVWDLSAPVPRK